VLVAGLNALTERVLPAARLVPAAVLLGRVLLLLLRGVVHIVASLLLVAATSELVLLLLLLHVAWLLLLLSILLRPSVIALLLTGWVLTGWLPKVLSLLLGVGLSTPAALILLLLLRGSAVLSLASESILLNLGLVITAKNVEVLSPAWVVRNFH